MTKEGKHKVANAYNAMKNIGIEVDKVKPVLKNLLRLFDKNWELIEAENYRALADAIFESEEAQAAENLKKNVNNEKKDYLDEQTQETEELERPLKRLRLRHQECPASSVNNVGASKTHLIKPKEEPYALLETHSMSLNEPQCLVESSQPSAGLSIDKSNGGMCHPHGKDKGKRPISPKSLIVHDRCDPCHPGDVNRNQKYAELKIGSRSPSQTMQPRDRGNVPISQVPEKASILELSSNPVDVKASNMEPDIVLSCRNKSTTSHSLIDNHPCLKETIEGQPAPYELESCGQSTVILDDCSSNLEIASSSLGEVKISLSCHSNLRRRDFCLPTLETILKAVENKCFGSCKTLDPNFSLMNLMQEMCECILKLGTDSKETPEAMDVTLTTDLLEKPPAENSLLCKDLCMSSLNGLGDSTFDAEVILTQSLELPPPHDSFGDDSQTANQIHCEEDCETNGQNQEIDFEDAKSLSFLVAKQCESMPEKIRSLHVAIDITKGQENIAITLLNDFNDDCAPFFFYINQNAVFQNAHVNLALARIEDDKCCSTCFGDCLSSSPPCACGSETGGRFAYTSKGLVKEDFLQECISMKQDPKKKRFCKQCPMKKLSNDGTIEHCKGHLMRSFIKECWWKCGCDKKCGNRVVQRGISFNLQVFMTAEGKGWGLRTLEDLPKGAFVCEYVGEVLTSSELFDRISKSPQGKIHSYPVLLDADWGSERVLKDEESLCLDATYYGNAARFINHRCYDSNLVEIPVEVETPDHHYYHLAFFTTRNVKSMEELTWDYGIHFEDNNHPIKAFRCLCGSKFCRNMNCFG